MSQEIITQRKPILKKKPSGKFKMDDIQREDIARLVEDKSTADWSEMGCYKTTTAEWLWHAKLKHIPNPRVLVISTKNGKGPYYESLHECIPEWDVFTIDRKKVRPVIGPNVVPYDVKLPDPLYFRPVVVLAHYHCFVDRACVPYEETRDQVLPGSDKVEKVPVWDHENNRVKMIVPFCNQLLRYHWDMVIVDEAHRIKDPDAQWTRNIKKLNTSHKHIMTGTGFVNKPSDIYSLLNFLFPQIYKNRDNFKNHYSKMETQDNGIQREVGLKPERVEEFRELVRRIGPRHNMLERFKNIKEPLPDTIVEVDLSPTQKKMYDEIYWYLRTLDQAGEPLQSPNVLSQLNRLRQICVATPRVLADYFDEEKEKRVIEIELIEPSSKLDEVMEIIDGLEWDEERRDQVAIFTNFNDPLKLLERRLTKAKIPYLRLLTKMSDKQRFELWHDIWPKKEHQVFLSTLKLGGESINLTSAHRAIFIDQDWSPVPNQQARGRIYRPGQTGTAQFIYIRAKNTVDFRVLDTLDEKRSWFEQIFGEVEEENGD